MQYHVCRLWKRDRLHLGCGRAARPTLQAFIPFRRGKGKSICRRRHRESGVSSQLSIPGIRDRQAAALSGDWHPLLRFPA